MRPSALAALILVGCHRRPNLFGFWQVAEIAIEDAAGRVSQEDYGTFEFFGDFNPQEGGDLMVVARYSYRLDQARLDPAGQPIVYDVETNLEENDEPGEGYLDEGEIPTVALGADIYEVSDWDNSFAVLSCASASPPTQEGSLMGAGLDTGASGPSLAITYRLER